MNAVRQEDMVQGLTLAQLEGARFDVMQPTAQPQPQQANMAETQSVNFIQGQALNTMAPLADAIIPGAGLFLGAMGAANDVMSVADPVINEIDHNNQNKGAQQGAVATVEGAQVNSSLAEPQRMSPANLTMSDLNAKMKANPSGIQFTRGAVANQPSVEQRMKTGFTFTMTNGEQKLDITKMSKLEQKDAMRSNPQLRAGGMRP